MFLGAVVGEIEDDCVEADEAEADCEDEKKVWRIVEGGVVD